jgi:hypothetical protein
MFITVPYEDKYETEWDAFIANDAVNGTFLQSRNFLNYHPKERFTDCSFLIYKDKKLVAVVPGCIIDENGGKVFSSHAGSTFGGLVIHKDYYTSSHIIKMIKLLENKLHEYGIQKVMLKITPDIFCKEKSDLLQYVLTYCGYDSYSELSSYIDFDTYKSNIITNLDHGQQGKLKQALIYEMQFKIINGNDEIIMFHNILSKNLLKFNASPVHTSEDLLDFKNNRLKNIVEFYGVFLDEKMIAGGLIFKFDSVVHAQYLSVDYDYIKYRPATFQYYKIIELSWKNGFKKLSWGISTEKRGTILNKSLLAFKESFGSKYSVNRGFIKYLEKNKQI